MKIWTKYPRKLRNTQRSKAFMIKWLSIEMLSVTDTTHILPFSRRPNRILRKLRTQKYLKGLWSSQNNSKYCMVQTNMSRNISTKENRINSKIISYWSASNHSLWRKVSRFNWRTRWIAKRIRRMPVMLPPITRKPRLSPNKAVKWQRTNRNWTEKIYEKSFHQCPWWTLSWCSISKIRKFWR